MRAERARRRSRHSRLPFLDTRSQVMGRCYGAAMGGSVPPEILEPSLAQRRVARGVRDRDMAEPVLYRTGVDTVICQLVAAAVPEHVEVYREGNAGPLADDLDEPVDGTWREGRPALGGEDVAEVR